MKRHGLMFSTVFLLMLSLTVSAFAQTRAIKLSFNVSSGTTWDKGAQKFKQLLEERSKGAFTVEVFPNATLASGNDRVELEMTQGGVIDIVLKSSVWLSQMDKRFLAVAMPWLFKDTQAALKFMDGKTVQMLSDDLAKNISLYPLAWGSGSFYQLYSNKGPIKTPDDIKGVKIRVPGNEVFVSTWRNVGAIPVTMSFGEVFPALQSGTIDGGTSPIPLIYSSKFYDVSKHISINNFTFEAIGFIVGGSFWNSLNADQKKLVQQAARDAMAFQREEAMKEDVKLMDEMKKAGVTMTVLTPAEVALFREKVQPTYTEFSPKIGESFMKQVEAEVKSLNAQ